MGARFETLMFQLKDRVKFSHGMNAEQLLAWVNSETSRAPIRFEATHGQNITLDAFAQEMPDQGFVISFTDVSSERDAVKAFQIANETLEQRVLDRTLKLEDALSDAERANASKTRFVAAASHDLLQPLSAAKLYFASIENSSVPDETKELSSRQHVHWEASKGSLRPYWISRNWIGTDRIGCSTRILTQTLKAA